MNPIRSVAIRLGGQPWLPKLSGPIVRVDKLLQRVSGQRVSLLTLSGIPELMLTVPDRLTGESRSTPLVCASALNALSTRRPYSFDGANSAIDRMFCAAA